MTYSITWILDGQPVTQSFDDRDSFYQKYDAIEADGCDITQYVCGAVRYDVNDPPVISDIL